MIRQGGSDHNQNRNDQRTQTREEREAGAEVMETETREVRTRKEMAQSEEEVFQGGCRASAQTW